MHIYCDLDGVLADFAQGVVELTGKHPRDISDEKMFEAINANGHFFLTLPLMEDALTLYNGLPKQHVTILTGALKVVGAKTDKPKWVHEHIDPNLDVIVTRASKKYKYAKPDHILIDDMWDNIDDWVSAGGIGIHHTSAVTTLKKLNSILKKIR